MTSKLFMRQIRNQKSEIPQRSGSHSLLVFKVDLKQGPGLLIVLECQVAAEM